MNGADTEFWSAAAEAVTGIHDTPLNDFDYTAPFTTQYQSRTAFMAYLAYNFRNADTSRTLAGMRDDLLYRWSRVREEGGLQGGSTLYGLERMLADDSCHTCLQKDYFRPGGVPLTGRARVGQLIHNWRTAMFVNSPTLDADQFGWPTWSGFSPAGKVGAWTDIDTGPDAVNSVVMPSVAVMTAANRGTEAQFSVTRSAGGTTAPMGLKLMGAQYWVVRAGAGLATSNDTLHVKIAPTGINRSCFGTFATGRFQASAVLYDHEDTTSLDTSILWQHPEWATGFLEVKGIAIDTVTQEIDFAIPGFGATHKAVLLVLTLVDTDAERWALDVPEDRSVSYRLDLKLKSFGSSQPFASVYTDPERRSTRPAWSPDGQRLAFSAQVDTATYGQIWHRALSGGSLVRLAPQALDQNDPDWSPRGDFIVYGSHSKNPNVMDIWRVGADGSSPTRLTQGAGLEMLPAIQPNGQGVAYLAFDPATTTWSLRWVSMSGYGDRLVAPLPGGAVSELTRPRWSKDGSTLYLRCLAFGDRLGAVPASGGTFAPVTGLPVVADGWDIHPGVGPAVFALTDSLREADTTCDPLIAERLVFRDSTSGFASGAPRFNRRGHEVHDPRYSPDGTRVAFTARRATGPATTDWVRVTANKAPRLANIPDKLVEPGNVLSFIATVTDSNGTAATFSAAYLPPGATLSTSGTFHWVAQEGEHFVVFRAIDPEGAVGSQVVRISNPPPPCAPLCGDPGYQDPVIRTERPDAGMLAMRPGVSAALAGNSLLDGAVTGEPAHGLARMDDLVPDATGAYVLRLATAAGGGAQVDRARLHVVDHASAVRAFVGPEGVMLGATEPALRVSGEAGAVLTEGIATEPGLRVPAGGELVVEWPISALQRGVVVRCERLGETARDGIAVQVPEGEGWRTVGVLHPRRHLADVALAGVSADRVRLVFHLAARVTAVERVVGLGPGAPEATVRTALPVAVEDGAAADALATVDGVGLVLASGAAAGLRFEAPPPIDGLERSVFVELDGRFDAAEGASRALQEATAPDLPRAFAFGPAHPNPSSAGVSFAVDLPRDTELRLEVLDVQGRVTRVLASGPLAAGRHRLQWDALDASGRRVGAGVYFARLRAAEFSGSRVIVLTE